VKREGVAGQLEIGGEGGREPECVVGVARELRVEAREPRAQADRGLRRELDAPARREAEHALEARHEPLLGFLVAERYRAREMHEAAGVHARARRVAVDECRQHGEPVARAHGLDGDARRLAARLRKPLALDLDGHAASQRGQHVRDELRGLVGAEALARAGELVALAAVEAERRELAEDARAEHEAAAEIAVGTRVRLHHQPEAGSSSRRARLATGSREVVTGAPSRVTSPLPSSTGSSARRMPRGSAPSRWVPSALSTVRSVRVGLTFGPAARPVASADSVARRGTSPPPCSTRRSSARPAGVVTKR